MKLYQLFFINPSPQDNAYGQAGTLGGKKMKIKITHRLSDGLHCFLF